jgi:hypothetical protein
MGVTAAPTNESLKMDLTRPDGRSGSQSVREMMSFITSLVPPKIRVTRASA